MIKIKLELDLNVLKKYMEQKGIDDRELAHQMGVNYVTLYRVMKGKRNAGNEFIARILNACDDLEFNQLFTTTLNREDEKRETS